MSTVKEARDALEKLVSADGSDDAWLAGVNEHCKQAGLSPDKTAAVVKQAQATRAQLAAGAEKNVKKKTPEAPQLDQGAAVAAKQLKS